LRSVLSGSRFSCELRCVSSRLPGKIVRVDNGLHEFDKTVVACPDAPKTEIYLEIDVYLKPKEDDTEGNRKYRSRFAGSDTGDSVNEVAQVYNTAKDSDERYE
jgi:hypothetical protein